MIENNNLLVPTNLPCPFCEYLSGRRPYTVWLRNNLVAVLVTREPRGISHVLAMPVQHYETILDIGDEVATALMNIIRRSARAIDRADERPGIAIWQNNGASAHQAIGHLHFHIAGTLPGGGTDMGDVKEISIAATEAIARKLDRADRPTNT